MQLTLAVDAVEDIGRLSELSGRTNQFNTGLLRLNEAQAASYVLDGGRCAVTVALRDRFSDSGVIAALFARREGSELVVDEIDVSCRALGRRLEPLIVAEAVARAAGALHPGNGPIPETTVRFAFRSGPRNEPARRCLEELSSSPPPGDGVVRWHLTPRALAAVRATVPVVVKDLPAAPRLGDVAPAPTGSAS